MARWISAMVDSGATSGLSGQLISGGHSVKDSGLAVAGGYRGRLTESSRRRVTSATCSTASSNAS